MATPENNPTPTRGWWGYHLQAPVGTPSPLRDAYEAIAAALHAAEGGDDVEELADAAAEACHRAEPLLVRADDLAHERALDALWRVVDGDHVVHLRTMVRNVRHQVMSVTPLVPRTRPVVRVEGPAEAASEEATPPPVRRGRKPPENKAEIVAFIGIEKAKNTPWATIESLVHATFGVKIPVETLKDWWKQAAKSTG